MGVLGGMVWEAYHKGVPLLGVPENPAADRLPTKSLLMSIPPITFTQREILIHEPLTSTHQRNQNQLHHHHLFELIFTIDFSNHFVLWAPTGVIILPQTRRYKGEIPQNLHIFALFDSFKMGNLMIPAQGTRFRHWHCPPSMALWHPCGRARVHDAQRWQHRPPIRWPPRHLAVSEGTQVLSCRLVIFRFWVRTNLGRICVWNTSSQRKVSIQWNFIECLCFPRLCYHWMLLEERHM